MAAKKGTIGERMGGPESFIVFDADGYPRASNGVPPPDDETLERLRLQTEHYRRLAPAGPEAPRADRPLHWKNRPT